MKTESTKAAACWSPGPAQASASPWPALWPTRGVDVILLGRDHERLVAALVQLEAPGHHRLVEADLADYEQVSEASRVLAREGFPSTAWSTVLVSSSRPRSETSARRAWSARGGSMPGDRSTSPRPSHPSSVTDRPSFS